MRVAIIGTVASSILGFRKDLIKELIRQDHEIYAFAIDYTDEQKRTLNQWGVTPVDYTLSRSGLSPLSDIRALLFLRKVISSLNLDIVFSYFSKPAIYGTIAAYLSKVPKRVAMLEGLGFAFTKQDGVIPIKTKIIKRIQIYLYRTAFPLATDLIFLNEDDKVELIHDNNVICKNTHVIGGIGLDLKEYLYSTPDVNNVNFLFIGRLMREKGIFEFLKASAKVKKQYPECSFTVLGKADTTSPNSLSVSELQSYIDEGIINYPGHVNDTSLWVKKSTVFVLPSYREGLPRSSQELMAAGRPILTTDVPGCRDTVVDGVNGFLVPPFDVSELVKKMIWFVDNSREIVEMGKASRRIAEQKFDVFEVNKRIIAILGAEK